MRFIHYLAVLAICLLSSCAIESHLTVNADYTGSVEFKIDISEMLQWAATMDSTELTEDAMDSIFADMSPEDEMTNEDYQKLEEVGISNLSFNADMEFFTIAYDYKDIRNAYDFFYVLDSSITEEERSELLDAESFVVEKDQLTILFNDGGMTSLLQKGFTEGEDDEDMDMSFMMNLFSIKQSYKFERAVAEVIDDDLPIRVKDHEIYFTINLSEYLDEFVGNSIVVKFE